MSDYCTVCADVGNWKVGEWFRNEDGKGDLHRVESIDLELGCINGRNIQTTYRGTYYPKDFCNLVRVHFEPFDLSDAEVRKSLMGKFVNYTVNGFEPYHAMITAFQECEGGTACVLPEIGHANGFALVTMCTFDNGQPCGKEVEG